jgi:hypothetical protein
MLLFSQRVRRNDWNVADVEIGEGRGCWIRIRIRIRIRICEQRDQTKHSEKQRVEDVLTLARGEGEPGIGVARGLPSSTCCDRRARRGCEFR